MNVMWMLNRLEVVEMLEVKFTLNARSGSYIILLNCGLCCNFPFLTILGYFRLSVTLV